MIARPLTPAQWCKTKRERDRLDLQELAHGTVLDLIRTARAAGVYAGNLVRTIEEDQA